MNYPSLCMASNKTFSSPNSSVWVLFGFTVHWARVLAFANMRIYFKKEPAALERIVQFSQDKVSILSIDLKSQASEYYQYIPEKPRIQNIWAKTILF